MGCFDLSDGDSCRGHYMPIITVQDDWLPEGRNRREAIPIPNRACSSVCTSMSNVSTSCFTRRAPGREDKLAFIRQHRGHDGKSASIERVVTSPYRRNAAYSSLRRNIHPIMVPEGFWAYRAEQENLGRANGIQPFTTKAFYASVRCSRRVGTLL